MMINGVEAEEEHGDVKGDGNDEKKKKVARLRVASDSVDACATVTEILLHEKDPPHHFLPDSVRQKLQAIVARNRKLARFVTDPSVYPGDELLAVMRQLDSSPTGRYMLARCFPGIPSFFKIEGTDSSTTGPSPPTLWT